MTNLGRIALSVAVVILSWWLVGLERLVVSLVAVAWVSYFDPWRWLATVFWGLIVPAMLIAAIWSSESQ